MKVRERDEGLIRVYKVYKVYKVDNQPDKPNQPLSTALSAADGLQPGWVKLPGYAKPLERSFA
ncbi:MAG: hypothetical protein ABIQ93_12070 [Saprospiraceae bacterium]